MNVETYVYLSYTYQYSYFNLLSYFWAVIYFKFATASSKYWNSIMFVQ